MSGDLQVATGLQSPAELQAEPMGAGGPGAPHSHHGGAPPPAAMPPPGDGIDQDLQARLDNLRKQ